MRSAEFAKKLVNGSTGLYTWRKAFSATATIANTWLDLSMAGGWPGINYWAGDPLTAREMDSKYALRNNAAPASRAQNYATEIGFLAPLAGMKYLLVDVLTFYPFIDMDSTEYQVFDNTTPLPRFAGGNEVLPFMVLTTVNAGGGAFTYDYINCDGIAATSPTITCTAGVVNAAHLVTTTPFLPLASGCRGVRSITGLQQSIVNGNGAGSLACIVLCRPIKLFDARDLNRWTVNEAVLTGIPAKWREDAKLSLLCVNGASQASTIHHGYIQSIWEAP